MCFGIGIRNEFILFVYSLSGDEFRSLVGLVVLGVNSVFFFLLNKILCVILTYKMYGYVIIL